MKFMRFSNPSGDDASEQTNSSRDSSITPSTTKSEGNGFRDNSEWSLDQTTNATEKKTKTKTVRLNIKRKRGPIVARQLNSSQVGVTMLQSGRVSVRGKTLFGEKPKTEESATGATTSTDESSQKKRSLDDLEAGESQEDARSSTGDDYDLDKIFKDTMKKPAGPSQGKRNRKNKKTKKQRKN